MYISVFMFLSLFLTGGCMKSSELWHWRTLMLATGTGWSACFASIAMVWKRSSVKMFSGTLRKRLWRTMTLGISMAWRSFGHSWNTTKYVCVYNNIVPRCSGLEEIPYPLMLLFLLYTFAGKEGIHTEHRTHQTIVPVQNIGGLQNSSES